MIRRLAAQLSLVRLTPHDTSTPEGRSAERYRRAAMTSMTSLLARGVRVFTQLVSVPLTVSYLGKERYGMWLTISSLTAVLVIANLGVGNSVTNLVADAAAKDDRDAARRYVTSAVVALGTVTGAIAALTLAVGPFLPWERLYNVTTPDAVAEAGPASIVFVLCWLANILLGLVNAVNRGYQDGFVDNAWEAFGSVLGLGALLGLIHAHVGLPWLVLAMVGSVAASHALNVAVLLWRRPYLFPRFGEVDRTALRRVVGLGLGYLVVLVAYQLATSSKNFVAAQILGAESVPDIEIPVRAFAALNMLFGVLINPLWPAFTDSLARQDIGWIRRALARAVRLSVGLGLLFSLPLVLGGRDVIHWWVGDTVEPSLGMLALVAVWFNVFGVSNALGVFLQAVHRVWLRGAIDTVAAVATIVAEVALAPWLGVVGVVLGMLVGELVFRAVPLLFATRRVLGELAVGAAAASASEPDPVPAAEPVPAPAPAVRQATAP